MSIDLYSKVANKGTYLVKNRQKHANVIKVWPPTRKSYWQPEMSGWIQAAMQQNTNPLRSLFEICDYFVGASQDK